jgi:polyhydroxybutyrate depolymerase
LALAGACLAAGLTIAVFGAERGQGDSGGPIPNGPRYPVIVHRGASLPEPGAASAKKVPLVLAFHPTGGSPQGFQAMSHLDSAADRYGFVVAYLSAPTPTKPAWKPDQLPQNAPYVIAQIRQLLTTQNIDPRRVYATGFSAGATMAFEIGCRPSIPLAGIAVVSGAMLNDSPPCRIAHPVSELLVLGTRDAIPIAGGPKVLPAATEQATWRRLNHCAARSSNSVQGAVTMTTWSDCDDDAAVAYYEIAGGTHQWPSPQSGGPDGQLDAADAVWSFFAAHPGPTSLSAPSASLRRLTARSSGKRRWLEAVVAAGKAGVTVRLSARATGAARRSSSVRIVRGAVAKAVLHLPLRAAGGRYAVTVTFSDGYGRSSRVARSVTVPRPRKS